MNKDKLLIVNLQNASSTQYKSVKDIGVWFWGRRLSNYKAFKVSSNGDMKEIIINSSDVKEIQAVVNKAFGKE